MSRGTILLVSFLAIFVIGGPIAKAMGSADPIIGIFAGLGVFAVLSAVFGRSSSNR